MDKLVSTNIVTMLQTVSEAMTLKRPYLIELDSAIGDGDLGITMDKGFKAAAEFAQNNQTLLPGDILMRGGMQIVKVAPSTMGTLMGTGLMRGGKALSAKEKLFSSDLVLFFEGFLQGVMERGKAKPGEKTIIDVLMPAVAAMRAYEGNDIQEIFEAAVLGARQGLENEKGMMSQHGKAAVFREKTKDLLDPGSMAVVILLEACRDSIVCTR